MTASGTPVVCFDLDGVIWRGDDPIPGSAHAVEEVRDAGLRVGFLSNNSSQPVAAVVEKLARLGVPADPSEVLTSALSAAAMLAADLPGSDVLACAGPGVTEALEAVGLHPVSAPPAAAVVVGFHRTFDFDELDRASQAVRDGARFVATNLDATYPVPGGLLPGAGSIAAAVATASGATPEVAGKPSQPMAAMVTARLGHRGVMVGDRPSTDGALAALLGWPFALVLSGVTGRVAPPGGETVPEPPPPIVGDDLASIVPALRKAVAAIPDA
ncbi:MAG TPA: HAD-IIA family hydrolase [Acidimicrobiia bacterium]|nr:HAD-IIA family hydrolase [Acidimicrobiia bacterium]